MALSGANAAAFASAQGDNVKMTDTTGDDTNLLRDASWRHVPCASMYNNLVLGDVWDKKNERIASGFDFYLP
jgi:hypothetical protein